MRVEDEVKRLMEFDDDLSRLKLDVIRTLNMFRKTLRPLRLQYQEGRPRIHGEGREPLINHLPLDRDDLRPLSRPPSRQ